MRLAACAAATSVAKAALKTAEEVYPPQVAAGGGVPVYVTIHAAHRAVTCVAALCLRKLQLADGDPPRTWQPF